MKYKLNYLRETSDAVFYEVEGTTKTLDIPKSHIKEDRDFTITENSTAYYVTTDEDPDIFYIGFLEGMKMLNLVVRDCGEIQETYIFNVRKNPN